MEVSTSINLEALRDSHMWCLMCSEFIAKYFQLLGFIYLFILFIYFFTDEKKPYNKKLHKPSA